MRVRTITAVVALGRIPLGLRWRLQDRQAGQAERPARLLRGPSDVPVLGPGPVALALSGWRDDLQSLHLSSAFDMRIAEDAGEGWAVAILPGPQDQPCGLNHGASSPARSSAPRPGGKRI